MTFDTEPTGAGAPAQFIYVWPSRELISRSWHWPASWHEAFQDAASRIGLAVALYGLGGSRLTRRVIAMQLSIGFVKFRVKRRGTSILIAVTEFTAPDSGGPDRPDGTRQPDAVDGLILGLHGSDKGVYLVVFHGHMPPIPAENSLATVTSPPVGSDGRDQGRTAENNRRLPRLIISSQGQRHGIEYRQGTAFVDSIDIDGH